MSLECFSNSPPVNISLNCISQSECCPPTPHVSLPLKEREAAWLGWLSAVPVPKATYLKGLFGTWRFNSVILPKNAGKLTSLLGPEPRGNPSRADGDAGRERTTKGFQLLGCPAVPELSC